MGVAEQGQFVFCYVNVANEHHGYKKTTDATFGKLASDCLRITGRGDR